MTDRIRPEKIRCDACPVLCYIADGKSGACDRYANHGGELVRLDALTVIESGSTRVVPFLKDAPTGDDWDGNLVHQNRAFVTAVRAGPTYPAYQPAPLIVSHVVDRVDMRTSLT